MKAGLSERVAAGADQVGAVMMVGVMVSALLRPSRVPMWAGATWLLALALARWDHPGEAADHLAPISHAVRMSALIALALLSRERTHSGPRKMAAAGWALVVGTALTFCGHGIEALAHSGPFVDLMIGTARRWTDLRLAQATAEDLLTLIGLQDLLLAGLLLTRRWRWVAGWMALWGLATALSRVTSMGMDSWHQSVLRLANGGAPLTLFLAWPHLARPDPVPLKP